LKTFSATSLAWFSPGLARELADRVACSHYDLTIVEYTQLLGYLPVLPAPVLVDMHNIESELMHNYGRTAGSLAKRLVARYEAGRLRRIESALPDLVQGITTVSARDAQTLRMLTGSGRALRIAVAPNGVSDAAFSANAPRSDTVVFVAHLGWRPNIDAAEWLVRDVWPSVRAVCPNLTLQLVGRSPAPQVRQLAGPGIEVHPDVPSVLPLVSGARVATAPLLAAGGTRLKILEALACGTPVVATPLGALGLEDLEGPALRLAEDPKDFADKIVSLASEGVDSASVRRSVLDYRWNSTLSPAVALAERLVQC
jgi:glycosyltransferase involved in cell wall biosynthesis